VSTSSIYYDGSMYFPLDRRQRDSGPLPRNAHRRGTTVTARGRDRYEPRSHMTVDDDGVGPSYLL